MLNCNSLEAFTVIWNKKPPDLMGDSKPTVQVALKCAISLQKPILDLKPTPELI